MKAWLRDRVQKSKMDFEAFNESPKATLIQRFDGSAVLLGPKAKKIEFENGATKHEAIAEAENFGWVIAIEHLHSEREHRIG
jgi:hypothetical protein